MRPISGRVFALKEKGDSSTTPTDSLMRRSLKVFTNSVNSTTSFLNQPPKSPLIRDDVATAVGEKEKESDINKLLKELSREEKAKSQNLSKHNKRENAVGELMGEYGIKANNNDNTGPFSYSNKSSAVVGQMSWESFGQTENLPKPPTSRPQKRSSTTTTEVVQQQQKTSNEQLSHVVTNTEIKPALRKPSKKSSEELTDEKKKNIAFQPDLPVSRPKPKPPPGPPPPLPELPNRKNNKAANEPPPTTNNNNNNNDKMQVTERTTISHKKASRQSITQTILNSALPMPPPSGERKTLVNNVTTPTRNLAIKRQSSNQFKRQSQLYSSAPTLKHESSDEIVEHRNPLIKNTSDDDSLASSPTVSKGRKSIFKRASTTSTMISMDSGSVMQPQNVPMEAMYRGSLDQDAGEFEFINPLTTITLEQQQERLRKESHHQQPLSEDGGESDDKKTLPRLPTFVFLLESNHHPNRTNDPDTDEELEEEKEKKKERSKSTWGRRSVKI